MKLIVRSKGRRKNWLNVHFLQIYLLNNKISGEASSHKFLKRICIRLKRLLLIRKAIA